MDSRVSISELDSSHVTAPMRRLLYLSVSGVFLDGYNITIISIAVLQLKQQFHLSPSAVGLLGASVLIGNFAGALLFGWMADRIGRKITFLLDAVFFVVFAILSAISHNVGQLILWRFLLGVGIGADYALASPIIAEALPANRRGRLLVINWGTSWLTGEVVAFAVSLALLPLGHDAWRWMLGSGAVPAVVVLFLRRNMTESPRWLRSRGRDEEADKAVGILLDKKIEYPDSAQVASVREVESSGTALRLLFGKYKRSTWFSLLNYVFEGAPFYALSVFLPSILVGIGLSKTRTGIAEGNLFLQLTGYIGVILCYIWVDRLGRKFVNYAGFGGVALGIILFELFYPPGILGVMLIFILVEAAVWLGPASTDNLFLGEFWPTKIRGTGAGIGAAAGRLSAIAGTYMFPILIASYHVSGAMWFLFGFIILGIVNTAVLGIETKNKPLEEMWGE